MEGILTFNFSGQDMGPHCIFKDCIFNTVYINKPLTLNTKPLSPTKGLLFGSVTTHLPKNYRHKFNLACNY